MSVVAKNKVDEIVARIERLPGSSWFVRLRLIIGVATFFDAFDALAIAYVLPVLVRQGVIHPAQVGLTISIGYVGQLIGALAAGWIAERYGRLHTTVFTVIIYSLCSFLLALSWNFPSLLVFRFCQGLGLGGEVPLAASYIGEIAKAKGRGRFILFYELVFPLGLMGAALAGYFIVPLGWRWLFVIGGAGALAVFFMQYRLPESPRWLASVGRNDEAEAAMKFIEEKVQDSVGGASLPPPQVVVTEVQTRKTSLAELFSHMYLRRTLIVWIMWFAIYLANYSLITWLPTIYSTVYKLPLQTSLAYSLATQATGLIGSFTCALLIDRVGRRGSIGGALILGGVVMLALWLIGPTSANTLFLLSSLGYIFISAASLAVYAYTPELYPTRMRALGTSTATAWLRLASIIGPTLVGAILATSGLPQVFLLFGGVALIGGIITAMFAIETRERVLEEVSP